MGVGTVLLAQRLAGTGLPVAGSEEMSDAQLHGCGGGVGGILGAVVDEQPGRPTRRGHRRDGRFRLQGAQRRTLGQNEQEGEALSLQGFGDWEHE